jgi:hypothetical protein
VDGGARGLLESEAESIQAKRKRPSGSKGTFELCLDSSAPDSLLSNPPSHYAVGTARRSVSFTAPPLLRCTPLTSAQATPNTWSPSCADGLRCLLASCCSLLSSAQPQALRLRKRKPWKLNASVLPSPLGRQSVASLVPAELKPNRRVCPHLFVTQPTHRPFERGDREPLTCAHTHTCVRVRLVYYDYTLTLL